MNEKKSFVMYTDFKKYKDALGTTGKAELFDAILDYENDRTAKPEFTDKAAEAFFLVYKSQSDTNERKWQETKRKRKEAARRRYARFGEGTETQGEKPTAERAEQEKRAAETPRAESKERKAERFDKPTVEEVEAYCKERGNGLDARTFYDFYESKGWKVGAARMRDWRACVRTWERRKKTESTGGRTGAIWGGENEVSQDIVDMI